MRYQEEQDAEGLKPTKYILGNKVIDGHEHVFYLRDDLPIATTTGMGPHKPHAHSIAVGPAPNTVICLPTFNHLHTRLIVDEVGDYVIRTLHI